MSNLTTFKNEMQKLKHSVIGTLADFRDTGSTTSTFYAKLIELFQKLKNDPSFKNCTYTFTNTKSDSTKGEYYIFIKSTDNNTCLEKLKNNSILSTLNIQVGMSSNEYFLYMKTKKENNLNPLQNDANNMDAREKRKKEIEQKLYAPLEPLTSNIEKQGSQVSDKLATMTENLKKNIKRIQKMMYG